MRRVAGIWNRPVIPTEKGAALGAAVAGAYSYLNSIGEHIGIDELSQRSLKRQDPINPNPEDVRAYHAPGGYLERFSREEARLIA